MRLFAGDRQLERPATSAPAPTAERALTGHTGTAVSDLRPAGIAVIDGARYDVVTEGEYIQAGEAIIVLRDDRWRRVVKRVSGEY